MERVSFLDKKTKKSASPDEMLRPVWCPKTGHPELSLEKAAEIKILSKENPVPFDFLLRSNLVQQELISLLDKTASQYGAGHTTKDAVAVWNIGERSDYR